MTSRPDGNFSRSTNTSYDIPYIGRVKANPVLTAQMVIALVAVMINMLLLFVLCKDPLKRFRNSGSVFIASLAMADMITATYIFISKVVLLVVFPPPAVARIVTSSFMSIGTQSSFLVVITLAFERFMAVAFPFRHKVMFTMRRACYTNTGIWCVALLMEPIFHLVPDPRNLWFLVFFAEILLACLMTLFIYPVVHYKFCCEGKQLSTCIARASGYANRRLELKKRLTVTILLVTVVLLVFTVPYFMTNVFRWTGCNECILNSVYKKVVVYYPVIYVSHFIMNPLIYAWRLPVYRQSLTVMICRPTRLSQSPNQF